MAIDCVEEFAILRSAATGWLDSKGLPLSTIAEDEDGNSLSLAAEPSGRLHILASISHFDTGPLVRGRFVEVRKIEDSSGRRYLDLSMDPAGPRGPFGRLGNAIAERMETQQDSAGHSLLAELEDWRRLVEWGSDPGEEAARGLYGELYVLWKLAKLGPLAATNAWTGPEGSLHDFCGVSGDIEVKSSARAGLAFRVSSISQLDPTSGNRLLLCRLYLPSSPRGGSIPEMIDELVSIGCPDVAIHDKVAQAGFGLNVDVDRYRFELRDEVWWNVDEEFPGMRLIDIPVERRLAVSEVSYTLDLESGPRPLRSPVVGRYLEEIAGV